MIIKIAKISDIESIMNMYDSCVRGMINEGINQWDNEYPNRDIIKNDIKAETYYVALLKNKVIAGVNIDQKQDNQYLDVKWKDKTNSFLVVHRLAVSKNWWGKGIGRLLMLYAEDLVIQKKLKSIRLDTYSENPLAISFYKKLGYEELGAINLKPNKKEYYCFEKII